MNCEASEDTTGLPCPARASWIIAVGTRKMDEQAACGRHLSRACAMMLCLEARPGAVLTVRKVPW